MKREAINHPKIRLLARDLGVSLNEARGLLVTLWTVAALNYPRGDIGRLPNDELAAAVDWSGDPDTLIAALVSRRLLDDVGASNGRLYVHDWHEHADDTVHYKLARAGVPFANGAESKRKRTVNRPSPTDGNTPATVSDSRRQSETVTDGLSSPSPSPSPSPSHRPIPSRGDEKRELPSADAGASRPTPRARSRPPKTTDTEWLAGIRASPAYRHVDLDAELAKMDVWLSVNPQRQRTRRFVVGWLNRIPPPVSVTGDSDADARVLWGWQCTNATCPDQGFHRTTKIDKPTDYRCPHLPRLAVVAGGGS